MTRIFWMILWSLAWAAAFLIGAGIIIAANIAATHGHKNIDLAFSAAGISISAYIFLLCFSGLPGARSPAGQPLQLGAIDGIWAIIAFLLLQGAGGAVILSLTYAEHGLVNAWHLPLTVNVESKALPFTAVMAGELAGGLWTVWYLRRLGREKRTDGSATGIAWRPASPRGYYTAAGLTAGILLMVAGITYLFPPNMNAMKGTGFDQLAHGPLWTMPLLLLLIVFIGPVLEEMLFRGIMFAGIASRWGAGWAVALTAVVFVAVHAPEKIHYPPGFIDVGLAALANAWLRLRFNSIKPGMLLHILYNGGSMLVLGLMK